jgi:hypothetical protein
MVSTGSAWVPAVTLIGATAGILYAAADSTTTHALFATAGAPAFRAILSTDIPALAYVTSVGWTGGLVTVATGTTTPAFTVAGTSGGIPYFSSASTWASSGALTQYFAILGGGAGNPPTVSTIKDDGTAVTITQNSVVPFTTVATGAIGNTLYLNAGKAGIRTATPWAQTLSVRVPAQSDPDLTALSTNAGSSWAVTSGQELDLFFGVTAPYTVSMQVKYAGGTSTYPLALQPLGGTVGIGMTNPLYSLDVSKGVGLSGTARFFDQTASTGATLVTITPGAAQTSASTILSVGGVASVIGLTFNGHACSLVANVMTCP